MRGRVGEGWVEGRTGKSPNNFDSQQRRGKAVYTLEGDGDDFKVDSLFDCEPVKLLEVLGQVRTRMKVENSTESKVLYSLKFS